MIDNVFFHIFNLSEVFTSAADCGLVFTVRLAALSVTDLARSLSLSENINKLITTAATAMATNDESIHFFLCEGTNIKTSNNETIKMVIPDNHAERVCESKSDIAITVSANPAITFHDLFPA